MKSAEIRFSKVATDHVKAEGGDFVCQSGTSPVDSARLRRIAVPTIVESIERAMKATPGKQPDLPSQPVFACRTIETGALTGPISGGIRIHET